MTAPDTTTVVERHDLIYVVRRLGWGVADQCVTSVSNFALGLYVARTFGASGFGAFTLTFVTYTVVLNAARGMATDPLMVRYSGATDDRWRRASSAASATALLMGVTAGALCLAVGLLLPSPLGPVFVALGVGLPGLMLQDSWRFAFFAGGRGASALANDVAWSLLTLTTLLALHRSGNGSVAHCMLVLGGTASLAGLLGAVQARVRPRPARALDWWRQNRHLSLRYLTENVSISGATQVRAVVLGAVVSLAAVGQVRAAEILMGPFLVVLMGVSQVAVPEASRVFHRSPARLTHFCRTLGAAQAVAAGVWGVTLLVLLPLGLGRALLKDLWLPAWQLLPAVMLTVIAASFTTAATAGLRAMGVARRSLRAQLTASAAYVAGGAGGAVLGGAVGTCWGVTLAMTIGAIVWWRQLSLALEEHDNQPEGVTP